MAIALATIDDLKREAGKDGGLNAFVTLNGGLRSSKTISYDPDGDSWWILHEISDTEAEYTSTDAMLQAEDIIAEAIDKGGLYAHWLND